MASIRYDGNKNIVGPQLRIWRKKCGLKQEELAAKMQIMGFTMDQQAISNIERNQRVVTDFEIVGFSRALRCTEKDLLGDFHKMLEE